MLWVLILEGLGQCTNEFAVSFIRELQRRWRYRCSDRLRACGLPVDPDRGHDISSFESSRLVGDAGHGLYIDRFPAGVDLGLDL